MYCKKRSTLQGSPCLVLRKRRGTPAQLREPEPLACIIIIVNISFWYSELGLLSCIIIIIIIVIINFQPLLILVLKTRATLLHYHCRNQYYCYYHKQMILKTHFISLCSVSKMHFSSRLCCTAIRIFCDRAASNNKGSLRVRKVQFF